MKAFDSHYQIISEYKKYLKSFINIKDIRIREKVESSLENENAYIPEPLIQFNPSYKTGKSLDDLCQENKIHPDLKKIFGSYDLYHHQTKALEIGASGKGFIVTSGTGSGKSLTFLATIFNDILQSKDNNGVKAIIVYPMNALINSQAEEIKKYAINYLSFGLDWHGNTKSPDEQIQELERLTGRKFPITFGKYTGQENSAERERMKEEKSNIILTNYMMLELIMTRQSETWMRESIAQHLEFLAFDELHTYRGRQGADVAMLIRRIKNLCRNSVTMIGTSATMATVGNSMDRKRAVIHIADLLFAEKFSQEQIISEKLETCTEINSLSPEIVAESIKHPISITDSPKQFRIHPLAAWLEQTIALQKNEQDEYERNLPLTLTEITERLSSYASVSDDVCKEQIMNLLGWIEQINMDGSKQSPRRSFLPFKLHQFISQTGVVRVSLASKKDRAITLDNEPFLKLNGKEIALYPVMFSRYSGVDFLCVKLINGKIAPRNFEELPPAITQDDLKQDRATGKSRRILTQEDFPYGYIILQEKGDLEIHLDEQLEDLPESWFNKKRQGLKNYYEYRLPRKIYYDSEGQFSFEDDKCYPLTGWYIPARLLFDPTAGILFDLKTGENTKLSRLGNEGRSSATTILGLNILKNLLSAKTPKTDSKFLSFTDNRQDAALQAGHFNDFVSVARLRAAIFHVVESHESGIDLVILSDAVYRELDLKEEEYAYKTSGGSRPSYPNEQAIRDYLTYRIIYDLRWGWRYSLPNLEQTALIRIDYAGLEEICRKDDLFTQIDFLFQAAPQDRTRVLTQVLNYFRTVKAFDHRFLTEEKEVTERRIKDQLDPKKLWSLNTEEHIEQSFILCFDSFKPKDKRIYISSIGPQSYLGKYIKREIKRNINSSYSGEELRTRIEQICTFLKQRNFLKEIEIKDKENVLHKGYQICVDHILWKRGDDQTVPKDEVRLAALGETNISLTPNLYFQKFYQQNFKNYGKTIEGREHTGQLKNEDRQSREENFRKGNISALFCSPTMELGIDISQLNIVHMRNVPPRPDNYAQRSGRAGRSGQSALVYTYCSTYSPHDRNYFKNRIQMVHGVVVPPKIDITNEELILSHLNAYLMMELQLPIRSKMEELIDLDDSSLPIRQPIMESITVLLEQWGKQWELTFGKLLGNMEHIFSSNWYSEQWLSEKIRTFRPRFNASLERWRILYRHTQNALDEAQRIIMTPNHPLKNEALHSQKVALRQRELLLNKTEQTFGSESEFYIFRYLASEGFLPGYNFTRLPVRSYVGNHSINGGEFISRPRFVALREFGPGNVIYHNGAKYKVIKTQLGQNQETLQQLKVSTETGYAFLKSEYSQSNNDPITKKPLKNMSALSIYPNLIELSESEAIIEERISCNEEYRVSQGYEIAHYFSFAKGEKFTTKAMIRQDGHDLLQLIYDQAARLILVNDKWKIATLSGFPIDINTGYWKSQADMGKQIGNESSIKKVSIYTTNTADILYIQPVSALQLQKDGVVSLAFALKRSIQKIYQVEENELDVWIMGQTEHKNILIHESSEGSLGVLKDMINDVQKLRAIFREAYLILGFDPDLHTDTKPDKPKASYEDLLSYYNQPYHEILDRHSVKTALEKLMDCEIDNQQGGRTLEEQYQYLQNTFDRNSATEKQFIDFLYENGFKLPDQAQVNIPDLYVSADFVYKTGENQYALVFCDGNVHDREDVKKEDAIKRENCRNKGYEVVVWYYQHRLEDFVAQNRHIFKKVR